MRLHGLFRVIAHLVPGIAVVVSSVMPVSGLHAAPDPTFADIHSVAANMQGATQEDAAMPEAVEIRHEVPWHIVKPAAGAYDFMPYGFTSAYDQGLVYSGGIVPGFQDAARFCPQCYNPNYFRRLSGFSTLSDEVFANALQRADAAVASGVGALNMMSNGANWNQYAGGWPVAGGWAANPNQGIHQTPTGIDMQGSLLSFVLGFQSSTSPYNIGSAYLRQYNEWVNPWSNIHLWQSGVWSAGTTQGELPETPTFHQDLYELARIQEDSIFHDSELEALRTEAYEELFYFIFRDPYYVYWYYRQQVNLAQFQSLYAYLPSYQTYLAYSQEIQSWQASPIPNDPDVLAQRYWIRYLHAWLEEQLKAEIVQFVSHYPELQQWVNNMQIINHWLATRLEYHFHSSEAMDWYADWQQRWQGALVDAANSPAVLDQAQQLDEAYPALSEYAQLNREVRELIPQFRNHPAVAELTQQTVEILEDEAIDAAVATHYRDYLDTVNSQTSHISFVAEKERYQEKLARLIQDAVDETEYKDKTEQFNQTSTWFVTNVYQVVAYCYLYYGSVCDSMLEQDDYISSALEDLYALPYFRNTLHNMAAYYEFYYSYLHAFYRSPQYLALEAETLQNMVDALAPIQDDLLAARADFQHNVDNIPAVQELKQARNHLLVSLLDTAAESDAEIAAAYSLQSTALRERLERMAVLASEIENREPATEEPTPEEPTPEEPTPEEPAPEEPAPEEPAPEEPPHVPARAIYLPVLDK